jgi:hypothetical protein
MTEEFEKTCIIADDEEDGVGGAFRCPLSDTQLPVIAKQQNKNKPGEIICYLPRYLPCN